MTSAVAANYSHYIGGKWVDADSDEMVDVINPATEQLETRVPSVSVAQTDDAIRAARTAFDDGRWSAMARPDRSKILHQVADALWRHREELADLVVRQGGATITQARGLQVFEPLERLHDYADFAKRDPIQQVEFSGGLFDAASRVGTTLAMREPLGVASLITGFNYPFRLNLDKFAPALAAGCAVVLKPSPNTCLDAYLVARIIDEETDLPKGVFNVLLGGGREAGELMASHPAVDKVSFTGSTAVGRRIMELASPTVKRVTLELGGKSANVIFADANLDNALAGDAALVIRHAGQGCSQLTRVLVEAPVYDEVVQRMTARAKTVIVGDPMDPATEMGPLISQRQWDRVNDYVQAGVAEGARLVHGGKRPAGMPRGYFMEPTIFADVHNDMKIAQEEIFGPVVCVVAFETEEDAVRIANDSIYGLNGAVWAGTLSRGLRVAGRMKTGMTSVNGSGSPAQGMSRGGYKQSALGVESGLEGVLDFTELKIVRYSVD